MRKAEIIAKLADPLVPEEEAVELIIVSGEVVAIRVGQTRFTPRRGGPIDVEVWR